MDNSQDGARGIVNTQDMWVMPTLVPRRQAEPQTHLIGLGVAPAPGASIHRLVIDPEAETAGTSELCPEGATTAAWGVWMGESSRSEAGGEHEREDKKRLQEPHSRTRHRMAGWQG